MVNFRLMVEEDLSFVNEVRNSHAREYLHDSSTFTVEESKTWFKETKPEFYIITIDEKPVGYFRISNHSEINRNLYIGADLHPKYIGKGLGFNVYKKFIPYIFEKHNLHKLNLEVLSTNIRAIRLYEKLGFKIDGTKREEVLKKEEWIDSIMMSLLKKEFKECL